MQQDAAIEEFLKPHRGHFSRISHASCGYFPTKFFRIVQRQKLREITSLYNEWTGMGFCDSRRGEIESLFFSFSLNETHVF
jgi:hypothetical protein